MPPFADPANLVVERYEEPEVEEGPEGQTSLELLQTVYRDRSQPLNASAKDCPPIDVTATAETLGYSCASASTAQ
jgi:hypothetical protein